MRVRTEDWISFCDERDCDICYRTVPDEPAPATPEQKEIQRLTLENSLLKGQLATIQMGIDLSTKEG